MKKYIYMLFLYFLVMQNNLVCYWDARSLFWTEKVDPAFKSWDTDFITLIDNIAIYIIWLVYFIAVMIAIYGWFLILTSWWEDDKVKKWKNIVIYMIMWIIIIFLASQVVHWVINVLSDKDIVWKIN
jgi:hypothetical protein